MTRRRKGAGDVSVVVTDPDLIDLVMFYRSADERKQG